MIRIKTASEIETMRASSRLVSQTLDELAGHVQAGISTLDLDRLAMEFIRKNGGTPSFLGYRGYRHTICASVNEEVVHGIPGKRTLKEGDIISIDVGVLMNGFHGDSARTFAVGRVKPEAESLLAVTRESLVKGVEQVRAGNRLGDVSSAIQKHVEVDEPETDAAPLLSIDKAPRQVTLGQDDQRSDTALDMPTMTEEQLLRAMENLAPTDQSNAGVRTR